MEAHTKPKGGRSRITIDGKLTAHTIAQWKRRLFDQLASCAEVELDLSRVSEIDAAGQQLLIAAKIHALARGTSLRVVAHSAAVVDVLDLCRLAGYFAHSVLISEPVGKGEPS